MQAIEILNAEADRIRNIIDSETNGSMVARFNHPLHPALDAICNTLVQMAKAEGFLRPIVVTEDMLEPITVN